MSNFGVTYLLKKNKGNNRLSIEDNIGEELHIHFGNMRLMLKNAQFREFASHALEYISDATNISVDVLSKLEPIFLFDLCRRGELPSLILYNEEYVPVGSLLCPVCNKFGKWKYKFIKDSHFLQVMKNKTQITPFDGDQVNYIGKNNNNRCDSILKECRRNKDICEKYPLFVTPKNIIRDGQHRAAALYYLYGPDFKVKIQRMETRKTMSSGTVKKQSVIKSFKFYIFNLIRLLRSRTKEHKIIKSKKLVFEEYKTIINRPLNVELFEYLKHNKNLSELVYFVDSDFALSGFPVMIKKSQTDIKTINLELEQQGLHIIEGHKNEGVSFIYGLKEDYLIIDKKERPVAFLQDKISSYAMSVKSFMPYAPEIQKYLNTCECMPETLLYLLKLMKCLFDKKKNGFLQEDIDYFEGHKEVLNDEFFAEDGLINKVFFGYTMRLMQILRGGGDIIFNSIIDDYRKFEY